MGGIKQADTLALPFIALGASSWENDVVCCGIKCALRSKAVALLPSDMRLTPHLQPGRLVGGEGSPLRRPDESLLACAL